MQSELKQLLELQEIDKILDQYQRDIQQLPQIIEEKKRSIGKNQEQLEEKKKLHQHSQVGRKNKEVDLAAQEEKIRKHETELNAVKSNNAYKVLLNEIEAAKKQKGLIEDEILRLMDEVDRLNKELKNDENTIKAEQQKLEQEILEIEAQIEQVKERSGKEMGRRENFIGGLTKELLNVYEYIREKKGGIAIVPIEGESCSGCGTNLTPSIINEVKKGTKIICCDSCSRILCERQPVMPVGLPTVEIQ